MRRSEQKTEDTWDLESLYESHEDWQKDYDELSALVPRLEAFRVSFAQADDKIYETVDQMPGYPNGMAGIMQYLSENVRYPATAQENGIQGRVLVRFVINTDGSVTDAKVIRSVDPDLDKEAVRVVSSMTKWRPGKLNGKAVRVAYTLPIMFRLE